MNVAPTPSREKLAPQASALLQKALGLLQETGGGFDFRLKGGQLSVGSSSDGGVLMTMLLTDSAQPKEFQVEVSRAGWNIRPESALRGLTRTFGSVERLFDKLGSALDTFSARQEAASAEQARSLEHNGKMQMPRSPLKPEREPEAHSLAAERLALVRKFDAVVPESSSDPRMAREADGQGSFGTASHWLHIKRSSRDPYVFVVEHHPMHGQSDYLVGATVTVSIDSAVYAARDSAPEPAEDRFGRPLSQQALEQREREALATLKGWLSGTSLK